LACHVATSGKSRCISAVDSKMALVLEIVHFHHCKGTPAYGFSLIVFFLHLADIRVKLSFVDKIRPSEIQVHV
jgi:hypothetical protein